MAKAFEPLTPERQELRLKAVLMRHSGMAQKDIATQLNTPLFTVQGWIRWGEKHNVGTAEPKPKEVVPNTVPLTAVKILVETAPVVEIPHNGHSENIIGEINLERRYEIENAELSVINSCPYPGLIAAIEEEEKYIISAVQTRLSQSQPTQMAEVAPVETGQPGPEQTETKKPIAAGWYLLGGILCAVAIIVLIILQM